MLHAGVLGVVLALTGWPATTWADDEEFATFRITDYSGSASLRGMQDGLSTTTGLGSPITTEYGQQDRKLAARLFLEARGFVYHPNMLSFDVGAGPILMRSSYVTEGGGASTEARSNDTLYDLSLRATVLRDKPFTGLLYYEHLNPTVYVGPALAILQESWRQGAQFALLDPVTPVPMSAEAEQTHAKGSGGGYVADDRTNRYSLTADRAFGKYGNSRLRFENLQVDSQSGSAGLPITRTTSKALSTELDSRLRFGEDDRYRITNLITHNELVYGIGVATPADRQVTRFFLDFGANVLSELRAFGTLDAGRTEQGTLSQSGRRLDGGVTWWSAPASSASLESRWETVQTTDLAWRLRGTSLTLDHQWKLGRTTLQTGYGARYDSRDQQANALTTTVIGERHVMPGVSFVTLDRLRVRTGTIKVNNEARSQVYIEGLDYLVSVLGEQTRLQRIATGNITDGQVVLVDYEFETGGTFATTQLDQNLSVLWALDSRTNLYLRWFDSAPKLVSGTPLFSLNTIRSVIVGARGELPLATLWMVGGYAETESRQETVLPFNRREGDLFVQREDVLAGQDGLRVAVRRQRVNYDTATGQDVDLTGYQVRYWVGTSFGADVQADWNSESDIGTGTERRRDFASLRARWQYRQLLMSLALTASREEQGGVRTSRVAGQWLLERKF